MWCRRTASDDSDCEDEEEEGAGNRQVAGLLHAWGWHADIASPPASHVRARLCHSAMLAQVVGNTQAGALQEAL